MKEKKKKETESMKSLIEVVVHIVAQWYFFSPLGSTAARVLKLK